MPSFTPDQLVRWTGGYWTAEPGVTLSGFSIDSRQTKTGQVFVALKTEKRDGHAFLGAAHLLGAAAALVSTPNRSLALPQLVVPNTLVAMQEIALQHRRLFTGPVIGISGSAGKTSTKNLLALLLEDAGAGVLATEGNLNNHLGVPLTLVQIDPDLHKYAVIEAGISAPGEMETLARMIEPDIALVTLIAPAHLADLGTIDSVAHEKAFLTRAVRPAGVAMLPRQVAGFAAFRDLEVRKLVLEPADVILPAHSPRDRVYYTASHRGDTTAISLAYGEPPPLTFTVGRVTDGMAQNAALAICAALWLGVSAKSIQDKLTDWHPASLRGEWRKVEGRLLYLDCYNANPASMADALGTFASVAPQDMPRLYLVGCMEELGLEAERYHRELGQTIPLRAADRVLVIGTQAEAVRQGAIGSGYGEAQVEVAQSTARMAEAVADFRGAVFVKGSRRYQLEGAVTALTPVEVAHA